MDSNRSIKVHLMEDSRNSFLVKPVLCSLSLCVSSQLPCSPFDWKPCLTQQETPVAFIAPAWFSNKDITLLLLSTNVCSCYCSL